mmetsp:Transcript_41270/g.127473  ORF Transcript_41270/g.127473 Transcript_41270/m.127473 type:complete len:278 (+) Transcript_41270:434-1267(+)
MGRVKSPPRSKRSSVVLSRMTGLTRRFFFDVARWVGAGAAARCLRRAVRSPFETNRRLRGAARGWPAPSVSSKKRQKLEGHAQNARPLPMKVKWTRWARFNVSSSRSSCSSSDCRALARSARRCRSVVGTSAYHRRSIACCLRRGTPSSSRALRCWIMYACSGVQCGSPAAVVSNVSNLRLMTLLQITPCFRYETIGAPGPARICFCLMRDSNSGVTNSVPSPGSAFLAAADIIPNGPPPATCRMKTRQERGPKNASPDVETVFRTPNLGPTECRRQ